MLTKSKPKHTLSSQHEWQKLTTNLESAHSWFKTKICNAVKPLELTKQQLCVLQILRDEYPRPIPVTSIRESMPEKMSDISRLLERLLKRGYISKSADMKDKRIVLISLTAQGNEVIASAQKPVNQHVRQANLTEEEMRTMNKLLEKLYKR